MTKGKKVAIAIHSVGLTVALCLLIGVIKVLMGTIPISVIAASAIFYIATLVFVTTRVLNGTDVQAIKMANFIDRK